VISDADVTREKLVDFLSGFGRSFYKVTDQAGEKIILKRSGELIQDVLSAGSLEVVPFRRGEKTWSVVWK
jgi:dihydroorotase